MPPFFCLIAARLDGGEGEGFGDGRRGGGGESGRVGKARAVAQGRRWRSAAAPAQTPCRRPVAAAAQAPVPATLIKCFVWWLSAAGFILCGSFLPQIYFLR